VKNALSVLESLVTVLLVLAGIGGLAYHAFRDGGWVTTGLGKAADAFFDTPLMALGLLVAMFLSYRALRGRQAAGHRNKWLVDALVYAFMASGVFFIARYVLKGEV
jgi:nitric oxide reductase large subunit